MTSRTRPRVRLRPPPHGVVAALVLVAIVAGCSGKSDRDDDNTVKQVSVTSTTNPHRVTTTTSTPTTIEAATTAFQRSVDALFAVAADPSEDDPRLDRNFTDPELTELRSQMKVRRVQHLVQQFPARSVYQLNIERVDAMPPYNATVTACLVDDSDVVERGTGKKVESGTKTTRVRAELKKENDIWRVSDRQVLQTWKGMAGCAQQSS
jgi:hypothetical protein